MVVGLEQDAAYRCVVCYLRACMILVCVQVYYLEMHLRPFLGTEQFNK